MKIYLLLLLLIVTTACANKNCREIHAGDKNMSKAQTNEETPNLKNRIRVFKYDGSLQCEMGEAKAPQAMQNELKNIKVFSAESRPDGLMHIQQCGAPTGRANVYEIDKADLDKARSLGFREWLFN